MWRCPKCMSTCLRVAVTAWADLEQIQHDDDEDEFFTSADGDHDWDGNSEMRCSECDNQGKAWTFECDRPPEGCLTVSEKAGK